MEKHVGNLTFLSFSYFFLARSLDQATTTKKKQRKTTNTSRTALKNNIFKFYSKHFRQQFLYKNQEFVYPPYKLIIIIQKINSDKYFLCGKDFTGAKDFMGAKDFKGAEDFMSAELGCPIEGTSSPRAPLNEAPQGPFGGDLRYLSSLAMFDDFCWLLILRITRIKLINELINK